MAAVSGLLGIVLAFGTNLGTDMIAEDAFLRRHAGLTWVLILIVGCLVVAALWAQQRLARQPGGITEEPRMPDNFPLAVALSAPVRLALPSARRTVCRLPLRDATFAGRVKLLDDLQAQLRDSPGTIVILSGLGGVGKSSVALEFAHRCFSAREYRIVWWIRAETPVTMAEDLGALAGYFGVASNDEADEVENLRTALAEESDWLLIFDNGESAEAVLPWLPHGIGNVIVTSRRSDWGGRARQFKVGGFELPEAVAYLNARVERDETADAEALAKTLGCLPLALAQAGAYVEARDRLPLSRYRELFADHEEAGRLLAANIPGYPHSVATTWLIHFEELAANEPAALELLRVCAHYDPESIDLRFLGAALTSLDSHPTRRLSRAGDIDRLAGELARTSLVTTLGTYRIQMHRLVAEVTRRQIASPTAGWQRWLGVGVRRGKRWRMRAVAVLASRFPEHPQNPRTWADCAQLAAHAVAALDSAPKSVDSADLQMRLGVYLVCRRRFAAGQRLLECAVAVYRKVEADGVALVQARLYLGVAQTRMGEHAAALRTLETLRTEFARRYGLNHPEYLVVLQHLIISYEAIGEYDAADRLRRILGDRDA